MELLGIQLTTGHVWLLGIAGTALALLVAHRLKLGQDNYKAVGAAKQALRSAFLNDIAEVGNPARLPEFYVHLAKRFPDHFAAVQELKANLGQLGGFQLLRDWRKYGASIPDLQRNYSSAGVTHEDEKRRRALAVKRLNAIIAHADA